MDLKKLFKAFAFVVCALFFVACEGPNGPITTDEIDEVYLYGNCTNESSHGLFMGIADNKEHTYSAASLVSMVGLTDNGKYLVGVRAYIGAEVTNASVWAGESYDAPEYVKEFTYVEGGWQYVLFDEPIKLNVNHPDIYIGYTITGVGTVLAAESARRPYKSEMISIDGGEWGLLSQAVGNALWSIQAIVAGGDYSNEDQYDLVVENVTAPKSTTAGGSIKVTCEIRNSGVKTTKNVEVKCQFGGSSTSTIIAQPLKNGQSVIVELPEFSAPTTGGASNLIVSAYETNEVDDNDKDNEVKKSLRVYTKTYPRNGLLIEQFTGQDCPNCPGGASVMAQAIEKLNDPNKAIWVAHHTYYTDEFSLAKSEVIASKLGANFAPACNLNRVPRDYGKGVEELIWHPGYATVGILKEALEEPGLATIELNRVYNAETRELSVEVKGNSVESNAYITAIVTQSGIEARQSGAKGMYVHNNAPREFLTAGTGDKLTLDAEGNYSVEYTYTIPEKVGTFNCVPENMKVVVFVHGDISKSAERLVYNAEHVTVVSEVEKAAIRMMSLYNESNINLDNVMLMPLSEQICR